MLDWYFNFTNKFCRLKYDLIRFFDHLVVAYFFGPPCISGDCAAEASSNIANTSNFSLLVYSNYEHKKISRVCRSEGINRHKYRLC